MAKIFTMGRTAIDKNAIVAIKTYRLKCLCWRLKGIKGLSAESSTDCREAAGAAGFGWDTVSAFKSMEGCSGPILI
jgi:hypothetical protein